MNTQDAPTRVGPYEVSEVIERDGPLTLCRSGELLLYLTAADLKPDPRLVEQFLHEGAVARALRHPHIAETVDVSAHDGRCCLAARSPPGRSLSSLWSAHRAREQPFPEEWIVRRAHELCSALAHAHSHAFPDAKPFAHRDLHPGNVFVADDGTCQVVGFGVTRTRERLVRSQPMRFLSTERVAFRSPELLSGSAETDGRTDVFSLGVLLWELVALHPLHPDGSLGAVATRRQSAFPPDLRAARPDCAAMLELVEWALQLDVTRRPTAQQLEQAFSALLRSVAPAIAPAPAPEAPPPPVEPHAPALDPFAVAQPERGLAWVATPLSTEDLSGPAAPRAASFAAPVLPETAPPAARYRVTHPKYWRGAVSTGVEQELRSFWRRRLVFWSLVALGLYGIGTGVYMARMWIAGRDALGGTPLRTVTFVRGRSPGLLTVLNRSKFSGGNSELNLTSLGFAPDSDPRHLSAVYNPSMPDIFILRDLSGRRAHVSPPALGFGEGFSPEELMAESQLQQTLSTVAEEVIKPAPAAP